MARYDRVQLMSAAPAPGGEALAVILPSLGTGLVVGGVTGLAAGSGKAGVITGVAVAAATAAALGLLFFVVKGAAKAA
jgi:hypothetical protein